MTRPPCTCGAPLASRDIRLVHATRCERWPLTTTPTALNPTHNPEETPMKK